MNKIIKFLTVITLALAFVACSSSKKKLPRHSESNYKRTERYPSAGEHAPIMKSVLDQNLYDVCRRERSERYCKRRLGTWRQ